MVKSYIPKHFRLEELFPPEIVKRWGDLCWRLMDDRILITADFVRENYGKMIANTYHWGGKHQYRGFRPFDCEAGAEFSDHKFGRAVDLVPVEATVGEIIRDLKSMKASTRVLPWLERTFRYVTVVEVGVPWLHLACRNVIGLQIIHRK